MMAFRGLMSIPILMACVTLRVEGQFQLSFGSPAPPAPVTARPTLPGGYDPACKDTIDNCGSYGSDACSGVYLSWAQKNCEATCGFCKTLPTNPPPCVDALPNCESYEQATCSDSTYRSWAEQNCRRYCHLCTASQEAQVMAHTTRATTLSPYQCVDKVDCKLYGRDACSSDIYGNWGRENCALYCGFCQGVATPPPLCADKNPNCAMYQSDLCSNPSYDLFVEGNCMKFCQRCSGASGSRGKRQAAPPSPTPPPMGAGAPSKGPAVPPSPGAPSSGGDAATTTDYPMPAKLTTDVSGQVNDVTTIASGPSTPSATSGPAMVPSEDCLNKIDNCRLYGQSGCTGIYASWAKANCPRYCGICIHPNDTKIECVDNIDNCNEYGADFCTLKNYRIFAEDNCRKHCNLCDSAIRAGGQAAGSDQAPNLITGSPDTASVAPNATECKDTVDYCYTEPDKNCFGIYEPWSRAHCPFRCGFCDEKPKCEDELSYCSQYDATACASFMGWARKNCRKTCNLCALPVRPTTDAPPAGSGAVTTASSGSGTGNNTPAVPNIVSGGSTPIPNPGSSATPKPTNVSGGNVQGSINTPDGTILTGTIRTHIIMGSPSVLPGACSYKGENYQQDLSWYDGCDYTCNCLDSKSNRIICTDRCNVWSASIKIPGCSWIKEAGQCCERLECTEN